MKTRLLISTIMTALFALAPAACMQYVAPEPRYGEAFYLDPLPASLMVPAPAAANVTPAPEGLKPGPVQLPPVKLVPGRYLYYHDEFYYYIRGEEWFFSRERRGPWHPLPKELYPPDTIKEGFERQIERRRPEQPWRYERDQVP